MAGVSVSGAQNGSAPPGGDTVHRAASGTDSLLASWNPGLNDPNSAWQYERGTAVARTRDLVANDGQAAAAVDQAVGMQVGVDFRYAPQHELMAARLRITKEQASILADEVIAAWDAWSNDRLARCDWEGELPFGQMVNLMARHKYADGEALAIVKTDKDPRADEWPWMTSVHIIDPDRLENPPGLQNNATLTNGVETDGRQVTAYHIRNAHPADRSMFADRFTFAKVPARESWGRPIVLHVKDKKRAGQRRGVSKFVAVLRKFKQLQDYSEKELASAALNAMFGAHIKTTKTVGEAGEALGLKQLEELGKVRTTFYKGADPRLNGVRIPVLAPGDDFSLNAVSRHVASFEGFSKTMGRAIAVALGVSGSALLGDYTGMSFSTWQGEMLPIWRGVLQDRALIAQQFCDPVLLAVIEEAIEDGRINPPAGCPGPYECTTGWLAGLWIGPSKGTIDPKAEVEAADMRVGGGFSSIETEALAMGNADVLGTIGQVAFERDEFAAKGFKPTGIQKLEGAPQPGAAAPGAPTSAEDPDTREGGETAGAPALAE